MVRLFLAEKELAGRTLLGRLDEVLDVQAALWIFDADSERWRLLLGIREVRTLGRKRVYEKIQNKLRDIPHLTLAEVEVMLQDDPVLQALKRRVVVGRDAAGVHLLGTVCEGRAIEDALVYRLL